MMQADADSAVADLARASAAASSAAASLPCSDAVAEAARASHTANASPVPSIDRAFARAADPELAKSLDALAAESAQVLLTLRNHAARLAAATAGRETAVDSAFEAASSSSSFSQISLSSHAEALYGGPGGAADAAALLLDQVGRFLDTQERSRTKDQYRNHSQVGTTGDGEKASSSRAGTRRDREDIEDIEGSALDTAAPLEKKQRRAESEKVPLNDPSRVFRSVNLLRPQQGFSAALDNSEAPFVPRVGLGQGGLVNVVRPKQHALPPTVADSFSKHDTSRDDFRHDRKTESAVARQRASVASDEALQSHIAALGIDIDTPESTFESAPHPYEGELHALEWTGGALERHSEQLYASLEDTPFFWVDTVQDLEAMLSTLQDLEGTPDAMFAVDLENHSYRSYQGFVCLMQISTRSADFVVDTIALREHIGLLNDVFANPRILKVMHGADMDIPWLQRDFGIYVVNMFDTGQAARVLDLPRKSLAWLLEHFCSVTADKQHQLSDWRVRPLPPAMLRYAREDTHYLLYIHDRLRAQLLDLQEKERVPGYVFPEFAQYAGSAVRTPDVLPIVDVWNRSRMVCLRKYEKDRVTANSHILMYNKCDIHFSAAQLEVLRRLFLWRDAVAREEDESPPFVLPKYLLLRIAGRDPPVRWAADVFAACGSAQRVPPLVRVRVDEILKLLSARDLPRLGGIPSRANSRSDQSPLLASPQHADPSSNEFAFESKPLADISNPVASLSAENLFAVAHWSGIVKLPPITDAERKTLSANALRLSNAPSVFLQMFGARQPSVSRAEPARQTEAIEADIANELDAEFAANTVRLVRSSIDQVDAFPDIPTRESDGASLLEEDNPSVEGTSSPMDAGDLLAGIPRSMADVYKLSNSVKRKRSRSKRSGSEAGSEATAESGSQQKRSRSDLPTTTQEFLKQISWIEESDERFGAAASAATKSDVTVDSTSSEGTRNRRGHRRSASSGSAVGSPRRGGGFSSRGKSPRSRSQKR